MTQHLSDEQAERYCQRSLPVADLLAVDDHLQECEECRHRLAAREPLASAWEAWQAAVGARSRPAAPRGWLRLASWLRRLLSKW